VALARLAVPDLIMSSPFLYIWVAHGPPVYIRLASLLAAADSVFC